MDATNTMVQCQPLLIVKFHEGPKGGIDPYSRSPEMIKNPTEESREIFNIDALENPNPYFSQYQEVQLHFPS